MHLLDATLGRPFDVLTLGECMAVLYPHEPIALGAAQTLALDIAGAEANLAIALSRLGRRVCFAGRVGDDPFGRRIRATLAREGVDVSHLLTDPAAPTGVYFREWLPDGARRVYYYRAGSAGSRLAPEDVPAELFAQARIVHLTGITPALSASCAATVARAIALARQNGALVSFDPNYRPRLWDAPAARAALAPLAAQADVLLMGHEDAVALWAASEGPDDEDALLERAAGLGPRVVVLKLAERGALALDRGRRVRVPAHPAAAVLDPVGAGDGFDAGFLAGWLRGDSLEAALELGARVGAAAVGVVGDYGGYPQAGALSPAGG